MANTGRVLRSDPLWQKASELQFKRAEPKFQPLELPALKSFFPLGLTRGILAELSGPRSSGKTSTSWHVLAQSTTRGEFCAVVDLNDQFDPATAVAAGVFLDRVTWIRCCGDAAHAMRAADLLLHAGGFGVVLLDLCEANPRALNRIPLSYWYRFRRAIEHTPTILLVCAEAPLARACTYSALQLKAQRFSWRGSPSALLLEGLTATALPRQQVLHKITSIRPEPLLIQPAC